MTNIANIKKAVNRILAANGYTFAVHNLGLGAMDCDPERMMNRWLAVFTDTRNQCAQTFDYYTGTGLQHQGKPVPPCAADVLYCLLNDSSANDCTFKVWCDDYGYNNDSIKALDIYNACKANAAKLSHIFNGGQQQELQEILQDY